MVAASLTLSAAPASAAPGDPWPNFPAVYLAQGGSNTSLHQLTTNDEGVLESSVTYAHDRLNYNALGYDEVSGYLYAISSNARGTVGDADYIPAASLIRIGQDNQVTLVGNIPGITPGVVQAGAVIGTQLYAARNNSGPMWVINLADGTLADTITLSSGVGVSDFAASGGYLWGLYNSDIGGESALVRIDPVSGVVDRFPVPEIGGLVAFGAAWTYGNGNLGFSHNASGTVVQLEVSNPAAAVPDVTLVSMSAGPASSNNDGAAIPGGPTDLEIVKTGTTTSMPGGTVTYELEVTNNGPGDSSGFVVTDALPASLTNASSPDANCTVATNTVTCVGGVLLNGESRSFTVQAQVDPTFVAGTIVNTASVLANEIDPDPTNNEDDHSVIVPGTPALTVSKSVSPASGTNVEPGDVLTYTLTFVNTGTGGAGISYTDHLATLTDDAVVALLTSNSTALTVGAIVSDAFTVTGSVPPDSLPHTVTYTATVSPFADQGDHLLGNFLTATGVTPPTDPTDCLPASTMCTLNFVPNLVVSKTSNPASGTAVQPGDEIDYTLSFTNTGTGPVAVDMTDHRDRVIDDADVTTDATVQNGLLALAITSAQVGISGSLDPGETEIVAYTVTVNPDGERGDDVLANFLLDTGAAVPATCTAAVECTTHRIGVVPAALPITGGSINAWLPLGALLAMIVGAGALWGTRRYARRT
ncbi:DUF7927 domain-containing protein [Homoserinimonas sp. A520]